MPSIHEELLVKKAADAGVDVYPLSGYYSGVPEETHTVVAGYAGLKEDALKKAAELLATAWK